MLSISETEYMSDRAREAFRIARDLVKRLPDSVDPKGIRCHELTRAVVRVLKAKGFNVEWEDGKFSHVDHTWISLCVNDTRYILDCYAVGRLPQVQLLECHLVLSDACRLYQLGFPRGDIRLPVVRAMVAHWKRTAR